MDKLFESFTQQKRESPKNISAIPKESDMRLTPENTVFDESVPEKSDDVILVQLDEVVTKSQEKGRKTNRTRVSHVGNFLRCDTPA